VLLVGFIGDAIGSVVGGITGAKQSAKGASQAANTQAASADKAIAEARDARLANQQLQSPFVDAGSKAIAQQMGLIGLNGTAAQQDSMNALLSGPEYTTGVRQGEEAILQNASATGGLRGGNTNNSLANFRADLLASTFNNQFQRLGQVSSLGQNAASGVGNAGMETAASIGKLLQQQGTAVAGGQIAQGNMVANNFQTGLKIAGAVAGF
jgi:hypothetical protein